MCAKFVSRDVETAEAFKLKCTDVATFKGSITGQTLRLELVHAARRQEMEYFMSKHLCQNVPREEILKYAKIAEEQPLYVTPAYGTKDGGGNQPQVAAGTHLAATVDEEEEEEEK